MDAESGSLCGEQVEATKSRMRENIGQYYLSDVINFDKTALCYNLPPKMTPSAVQIKGKEHVKST